LRVAEGQQHPLVAAAQGVSDGKEDAPKSQEPAAKT
jgi:hypothetical protein